MDFIDIYRIFHSKTAEYIIFSSAHGTFSMMDHVLSHKTSLNKLTKVISSIFTNHIDMKLEINYRKKNGKTQTHEN